MPSFLVKRIAEPNFQEETLEEVLERVSKITNRNFDSLKNLLYGNVDFVNVNSAGMLQTWQDSNEGNVDHENPMTTDIYMPPETSRIHRVLLRLKLKEFRGYTRSAASQDEISSSTEGGGAIEETTATDGGVTTTSDTEPTVTRTSLDAFYPFATTRLLSAEWMVPAGGHDHGGEVAWDDGHAHQRYIEHTHDVEIPGHNHGVTVPNHSHWLTIDPHSHVFAIPGHTHDLVHGVYRDPFPVDPTVTISVNGVDRTAELGGPFHISEPELDITEWIEIGGWNTIAFGCREGALVRLQVTTFTQAFIAPVDRLEPEER